MIFCQWMQHPDPIGYGLAREAYVEPAGPDCIIPGLQRPVKVLGLQVSFSYLLYY